LDPRLDLFAWITAHDMLDLRFLPYGTCQYHHTFPVPILEEGNGVGMPGERVTPLPFL
jgi:hypothetical protein